MVAEPEKRVPPYLPFKTFISSLDSLSQGVPPRIDRTLWRSQSGVTQGLIMNAYRFFGLVEDEPSAHDKSTEELDQLAKHNEKRPETLRGLIEAQYWEVLGEHDLTKMTMKMLEDAFEKAFSVGGGTKQKAITFFLKAAKFSDMPLSPYLTSQLRATRKKRGPRQRPQDNDTGQPTQKLPAAVLPTATTHMISLESGGTLTVSITANPFKMPQQDRDFVFSLIDKLQKYEDEHPSGEEEEEEIDE
jgi:antitoxin component of MazEF toxin-antitoxin module